MQANMFFFAAMKSLWFSNVICLLMLLMQTAKRSLSFGGFYS